MNKSLRESFICICILSISILLVYLLRIGCPIKFITGISCPGCGMTRAYYSLLHLDFKNAFYYHPLFWTLPIIILLILFKDKINPKAFNFILWFIILLFLVIYVIRLFSNNSAVIFEPSNSLIFKLIKNKNIR